MIRAPSPRAILVAALVVFAIYAFPGFVGWDTEAHLLQSRSGIYTDGHPPIIAAIWRVVELVITGPLGMLAIQALTLLVGLYAIFRATFAARAAAIAAAAVFLFPPIAGVTALVIKDGLMAGFLALGAGWLAQGRTRRGLVACAIASAMRWNALAATLPIVLVLLPSRVRGVRRVGLAILAWIGITVAAMGVNALLTDRHLHLWYGTHAYEDIAGTMRWIDDISDADARRMLAGIPLVVDDRIQARTREIYNPADYRQLTKGPRWMFEEPYTSAERDAVAAAWWRVVIGHPDAYLRYRWDNFRTLVRIDHPPTFSEVYVWFNVIAEPGEIDRTTHDASASRIQGVMLRGSIALSRTFVYWPWIYLLASLGLLVACRRDRMIVALLISGLMYELAWFVLDPTGDFRYSQWMITCCSIAVASWITRCTSTRTPIASPGRVPGDGVKNAGELVTMPSLERIVPDELSTRGATGRDTLELHVERYELAARHARGRVLDLASGTGYGTRLVGDRGTDLIEVVGVDVAVEAIAYAEDRYGRPGVRFELGDALAFEDPIGFDTVISLETIEHIEEPARLFARLVSVLRPGGVLIASVPVTPSVDVNPHHRHDFTERSFRALAAVHPLDEIECLRQVQKVPIIGVLRRSEARMTDMRPNLLGYYAKHPRMVLRRIAATIRHGFTNRYATIVWRRRS